MRSFIAVLLLVGSAFAQPTTVNVSKTFTVVVSDYYQQNVSSPSDRLKGSLWSMAVCDYNVRRGYHTVDKHCEFVVPDEKIYLPEASVLECVMYAWLNQPCPPQTSDARFAAYASTYGTPFTTEQRTCMKAIEAANPGRIFSEYLLMATMLARRVSSGQELQSACATTTVWNGVIRPAPMDYLQFDAKGQPLFTVVLH